jgi:Flp pilus assembly pilin Flp
MRLWTPHFIMHSYLKSRRLRGRRGQTLVEYALIISLIVVVSIAVLLSFGGTLQGFYSSINSQVARSGTGS